MLSTIVYAIRTKAIPASCRRSAVRQLILELIAQFEKIEVIATEQMDCQLLIVEVVMNNKLFVGNISLKMSEDDLRNLFLESGEVLSVAIPTDRDTGRKRGFAFVEMENQQEAQTAIDALNGKTVDGKKIVVNASRPSGASI